jgi:hypothetical protein
MFHLKAETESSLRKVAFGMKYRTMSTVQNCDNYRHRDDQDGAMVASTVLEGLSGTTGAKTCTEYEFRHSHM